MNQTFYVGIKCFKSCSFKISALFSDELEVKTNVYHTISINKAESKVLRYRVPDEKDIKSVEFIARVNSPDHQVRMFINPNGDGKAPTSSHFEGSQSWKDAVVYHLSDSSTHAIP